MSRKNLEFIHIVFNVLSLREFSNILHFHFLSFFYFLGKKTYLIHTISMRIVRLWSIATSLLPWIITRLIIRDDDDVNINKENEYTHSEWYNDQSFFRKSQVQESFIYSFWSEFDEHACPSPTVRDSTYLGIFNSVCVSESGVACPSSSNFDLYIFPCDYTCGRFLCIHSGRKTVTDNLSKSESIKLYPAGILWQ